MDSKLANIKTIAHELWDFYYMTFPEGEEYTWKYFLNKRLNIYSGGADRTYENISLGTLRMDHVITHRSGNTKVDLTINDDGSTNVDAILDELSECASKLLTEEFKKLKELKDDAEQKITHLKKIVGNLKYDYNDDDSSAS